MERLIIRKLGEMETTRNNFYAIATMLICVIIMMIIL